MYESRDLGGTPDLDAKTVQHYNFARFDFPSPTGTIRYTNKPGGYTGNIDGVSATWTEYDFRFTDISNSQQTIMDVSSISIANLNNTWSGLMLNIGIEMRPILLLQVWFNISTGATTGKMRFYSGRMEVARYQTGRVEISVVPHRYGLSQMLPGRIIGPTCGYIYGDPRTCQYPGPFTGDFESCDHSRTHCQARSNLVHFGGEDLIPKEKLIWKVRQS